MPSVKDDLKARVLAIKAGEKAKSKSKSKKKEKENKSPKSAVKKKRNPPSVRWANADYHHLTDQLLTLVEASPLYRQSFGFHKATTGAVQTGGKRPPDLHAELAQALFIDPDHSKYTTDDLESLASVVGNRIGALKKGFRDHREKLGATGQGLVDENHESEIESGSSIENIWDLIKQKFPWYKRMQALMGSSPIVDRTALVHSQTHIDLTVLDGKNEKAKKSKDSSHSESESDHDDTSSDVISGCEKTDEEDEDATSICSSSPTRAPPPTTPKTPATRMKTEPATASAARGTKRKTAHDQIQELASQDRVQRLKITEIHEREKTNRSKVKYETKSELELKKMQHQHQEAERQRQHEYAMLERQIQLERMRQAGPSTFGPPGGPAFGVPPPPSVYDPNLFQ